MTPWSARPSLSAMSMPQIREPSTVNSSSVDTSAKNVRPTASRRAMRTSTRYAAALGFVRRPAATTASISGRSMFITNLAPQ